MTFSERPGSCAALVRVESRSGPRTHNRDRFGNGFGFEIIHEIGKKTNQFLETMTKVRFDAASEARLIDE